MSNEGQLNGVPAIPYGPQRDEWSRGAQEEGTYVVDRRVEDLLDDAEVLDEIADELEYLVDGWNCVSGLTEHIECDANIFKEMICAPLLEMQTVAEQIRNNAKWNRCNARSQEETVSQ